MTTAQMTIAENILQQLGGNKFIAMTGAYNLLADTNFLRMTLRTNKSKAKWLKITLNSLDLYDMQFIGNKRTLDKEMAALGLKLYNEEPFTVAEYNNVYFDQLQDIFTKVTGMLTSM